MNQNLAWFYWDPPRFIFTIPYIDRPVAWYGLWFVFGFIVGFFLIIPIIKRKLLETRRISDQEAKKMAISLTDKLTWAVIIGTIVGARLGHVFFYDWPRYQDHLIDIFKIWEGGLASHGGTIGVMIATYVYLRSIRPQFPEFTYINLLDFLAVPTAFVATCIRIGNFFNQEIYGPPSNLPWAVIFGHPYDGAAAIPRHPTQLYEALVYFITFCILYILWYKKSEKLKPGTLIGLFMILVFGSRFFLEFLKPAQSLVIDESFLLAGQYLSIPFILLGIFLLWKPRKKV
jgi:phosphatidylglycerol---prolipoprotein diacylglyceryl transferase